MRAPTRALALVLSLAGASCSLAPVPYRSAECPETLAGLSYVSHVDDAPSAGGWWVDDEATVLAWSPTEDSVPPIVLCDDTGGTFDYRDEPEPIRDADGTIIGRNYGWDRQEFAGYDYNEEDQ